MTPIRTSARRRAVNEPTLTREATKTVTFTGAAGLGAVGNVSLFTVTGAVHIVSIDNVVDTTVTVDGGTGAASVKLGVVGSLSLFIGALLANLLTSTNKHWQSTTPTAAGIAQAAAQQDIDISGNIVIEVTSTGTQIVNGGAITSKVVWFPITPGSTLVPA